MVKLMKLPKRSASCSSRVELLKSKCKLLKHGLELLQSKCKLLKHGGVAQVDAKVAHVGLKKMYVRNNHLVMNRLCCCR